MNSKPILRALLPLLTAGVLTLSAAPMHAAAEPEYPLPFTLNAPVGITLAPQQNGRDGVRVSYGKDSSLNNYFNGTDTDEKLEIRKKYGYTDLWIKAQLDWSIDSPDDWHYNAYWDSDGYDTGWVQHLGTWAYINLPVTGASADSEMLFLTMGNPGDASDVNWNGTESAPGWKTALRAGQYKTVTAADGSQRAALDLTEHTLYVRMRWQVTLSKDDWNTDQYLFSGWSAPVSAGTGGTPVSVPSAETTAPQQLGEPPVSDTQTALQSSDSAAPAQSGSTSSAPAEAKKSSHKGGTAAAILISAGTVGFLVLRSRKRPRRRNTRRR